MGLFKKIFAGSSGSIEEKVLPWIALTTIEQLDGVLKNSKKRPQIIFKYSTRCGISRVVLKEFERDNQVLENYSCGEILFAESAAQKEKLWKIRRSLGEAVKSVSIYKEEDTVVPRAELPFLLKGVKENSIKIAFSKRFLLVNN